MMLQTSVNVFVAILSFVTMRCSSSSNNPCVNPLPGLYTMIRGVDITTLDVLPLNTMAPSSLKYPLIKLTCNMKKTWRRPGGPEYQLPDQIWAVTPVSAGWLSAEVKLFKAYSEIREAMTANVGVDGPLKYFSFSAAGSFSQMQHTIMNTSNGSTTKSPTIYRYVMDVSAFDSAQDVDFIPSSSLSLLPDNELVDPIAQILIDYLLSGTFESNPAGYKAFIQEFGTHYFTSGRFGGLIRTVYETKSSYLQSTRDQQAKLEAKASYLKFISAKGGHVSESTTVSQQFESVSTKTINYYGGDTNLFASDGIQSWQRTVNNNPWLFSGRLKPISDLITDETKRLSMVEAVNDHILRSYLDEIERLINIAMSQSSSATLDSLLAQTRTMRAKTRLMKSEVEQLSQQVDDQFTVPTWFTSNTELCFKWRPDGDGGQCGGGTAAVLCAKPNSMTSVYRDDTDRRPGGCRLQWGIKSSGYPSWFNEIQICYRWYPDGNAGQCGGGALRELCAPVNQYTSEYRDDTDSRSGGCRMSWRIYIPNSAPPWIKTIKLCFSWYPDGDGGQCGPALSRNMCAEANQWTPYYRDDSDGRHGGCRLSWGIELQT